MALTPSIWAGKNTFLLADMEPSLPSPVCSCLAEGNWRQWDAVGTGAGLMCFVSWEMSAYCKLVNQVGQSL